LRIDRIENEARPTTMNKKCNKGIIKDDFLAKKILFS
jgi:hypothetical protein